MALNIITWEWGNKYQYLDAVRLASQVRKNLTFEHQFHLFSDYTPSKDNPNKNGFVTPHNIKVHPIKDADLIGRHCFCRLRMFDPQWQQQHNLTGKIVSLDLDLVITGALNHLFAGEATFKILHGANASNPNPFNASVMMLRSGQHTEVWDDFSLEAAAKIPYHEFPDDQGWIWHKLPQADGWKVGAASGIYAFQKPGWPAGTMTLPDDARIVTFIGHRKPQQFSHLPWIQKYWTAAA